MRLQALLFLTAGLLLGADDAKKEHGKIKGNWTVVSITSPDGKEEAKNAKAEFMKDAAGNRSKADTYYGSKSSDPNWTPCDYSETSPNIPDSCN